MEPKKDRVFTSVETYYYVDVKKHVSCNDCCFYDFDEGADVISNACELCRGFHEKGIHGYFEKTVKLVTI